MSFLFLFLVLTGAWPQWRGPNRDGHATSFQPPAAWPARLTTGWSVEVGEGYSSPVSDGSTVCVHSRRGDDELVTCINQVTGKTLWTDRYAAPFKKNSYAMKMSGGPFATPLLAAGRLYAMGVNAVLTAYDSASGKVLWRQAPPTIPTTKNMFCGTAASPLMENGRLIVFRGDDQAGELLALDPATGKVAWRYSGESPAYASPVAATIGGQRQFILMGSHAVVGVSDQGKELWRFPFLDEWRENIVTPVVKDDLIFISGTRLNSHALRITKQGAGWQVSKAWTNTDLPMYMSSPVLDGETVYGLSSKKKGQVFGLNLKTGATLWTTEGRFSDQAAVFVAGDYLLIFSVDGQLIVARRNAARYQEVRRYELTGGDVYSSPALSGKTILIKDSSHLRSFQIP